MGRVPGKTVRPLGEIRVVLPRRFFDVLFEGTTWEKDKIRFEFQFTHDGVSFRMILEGEVHSFVIARYRYHQKIRILSMANVGKDGSSVYVKGWKEAAETVRNMIQSKRVGNLMATGEKVPISVLCRKDGIRRCHECDDLTCEHNKVIEKARQA